MQFLVLTRRRVDAFPPEAFSPELIRLESNRVRELYTAGVVRQIWRRGDIPGATFLLEASSADEARAAFESLPLYQKGMLELVSFFPLEPYPGFGPIA